MMFDLLPKGFFAANKTAGYRSKYFGIVIGLMFLPLPAKTLSTPALNVAIGRALNDPYCAIFGFDWLLLKRFLRLELTLLVGQVNVAKTEELKQNMFGGTFRMVDVATESEAANELDADINSISEGGIDVPQ
jgi:hypothetical protein